MEEVDGHQVLIFSCYPGCFYLPYVYLNALDALVRSKRRFQRPYFVRPRFGQRHQSLHAFERNIYLVYLERLTATATHFVVQFETIRDKGAVELYLVNFLHKRTSRLYSLLSPSTQRDKERDTGKTGPSQTPSFNGRPAT